MMQVYVEGVRRNFMLSSAYMYTVTLIDETKKRMVLFPAERHEVVPITAKLHEFPLMRPYTINALYEAMKLNNMTLAEIRAEEFQQSPKFLLEAVLTWRHPGQKDNVIHMQISPGDAIGLKVLSGCRLMLSDSLERLFITLENGLTPELYQIYDLLRREGINPPKDKKIRLGASSTPMANFLVKEFKAEQLGKAPVPPEEDLDLIKKEYLEFLLGADYNKYKEAVQKEGV